LPPPPLPSPPPPPSPPSPPPHPPPSRLSHLSRVSPPLLSPTHHHAQASLLQKDNAIVAEYNEGSSFGELALLYNAPRAATVTCTEGGRLWALERKRFRYVMVQTNSASLTAKSEGFLKSVSILSGLSDHQRGVLADKMEELKFKDAEYLVSMGDIADALYFIKAGEVAVHQGDSKGDLVRMTTGQFFGESCLEPTAEDAVRKANIVAVGDVTVLRLTAAVFKEEIGVLSDVVAYNFKRKVMEGFEVEKTKVFSSLDHDDQEELLSNMKEVTFTYGAKIIEQGSEQESFYVIKSGTCKVLQTGAPGAGEMSTGVARELATLSMGQFFGERALLKGDKASVDVVASGDKESDAVKCYTLDRTTFIKIFGGPLEKLLDDVVRKRDEEASRPDRPKFADLELRRILGVGTFGRVKLVVHKQTGVTYALKCMRKAQVVATKQQSHVLNEKKILAMMEHPFILALVQTYQDAGELYMLEELALGGELFTLLAKRAPLFDSPARFYAASVVSMFSYMHSLKVIYRDLKPENLLLDKEGYLKLVDFGFAKILNDRTWTLCGTPEYLAPEIILNKGHGFGADWWCVGILTFECLTGTTPFVSNDPMEGYRKIIKCRVPWPAQLSMLAKDFIDRLLTVDPTRRLGCLKAGSKDVRAHSWFQGLDYRALESKQLPAPYVPKIKSATDDSNFDTYTDEGKINYPQEDFPKDMFAEFADEWV
jgi:CRP-like cAMP-binding protein